VFLLHSFSACCTCQVHYLWRVNLICVTVPSEQLCRRHTETTQHNQPHQYIQYTAISSQDEKRIGTTNPQQRQDLTYFFLPSLLNYLLTHSMEQSRSWEANRSSASQEILRSDGTRTFNIAFSTTHHLSLSWARSIQVMSPQPTSWRTILILSCHLRLGLPSCLP